MSICIIQLTILGLMKLILIYIPSPSADGGLSVRYGELQKNGLEGFSKDNDGRRSSPRQIGSRSAQTFENRW